MRDLRVINVKRIRVHLRSLHRKQERVRYRVHREFHMELHSRILQELNVIAHLQQIIALVVIERKLNIQRIEIAAIRRSKA